MKKALVVVDYQNDFVTGSLGTKEAQKIMSNILKKIEEYKDDDILYTRDTHTKDYLKTQEGQNLPVEHCIVGTNGWHIVSDVYLQGRQIFNKSTFGSTELARSLAYKRFDVVEFIGVCTGICVISNALILKAYDLNVKVVVDASCCACVTPKSHKNALNAMKMCQVEVINE